MNKSIRSSGGKKLKLYYIEYTFGQNVPFLEQISNEYINQSDIDVYLIFIEDYNSELECPIFKNKKKTNIFFGYKNKINKTSRLD